MTALKIYYTSDIHGYIFPVDYASGQKKTTGLLACAAGFKKDGNTLVIDGGDTIQGSPFTLYSHRQKTGPHPIAQALNKSAYDYVTLGNHDFNYGEKHLKKYLEDLDAQCLCANVSGNLPLFAYTVHTLENGLRVGLVGAVTDWVNVWEKPGHIQDLSISEPFEAVKNALESLNGQADVTVCIYHGGFENDIQTGQELSATTENIGYKIASQLDFDLLLTAHQHMPVEGAVINGTYIVQPPHNATQYLEILWDGTSFSSTFRSPTGDYDLKGMETAAGLEKETQKWLDEPVGFFEEALEPGEKAVMALNGTPLADFFNQVQLDVSGADISVTSLGNQVKGFRQAVTVRDVVSTYIYPNTLVVLQITGAGLKAVLEQAATYLDLENGIPQVSKRFLQPKVEHYNYDFFANVEYTADLKKPALQRVSDIFVKGKPVADTDTFTICMNNYRKTGAGGYDTYTDAPVIREIQSEMSELIIAYLEKNPTVSVERFPAPHFIY